MFGGAFDRLESSAIRFSPTLLGRILTTRAIGIFFDLTLPSILSSDPSPKAHDPSYLGKIG